MDSLPRVARYKMSRYVEQDEVLESPLYGEDKYSLFFDMIYLGAPRDEYRVSLGTLVNRYFWAAMWVDKHYCELRLEMTYLGQDDVEDILQLFCNVFDIELKLVSNDNYMMIPSLVKPGERVTWEV